ncbi:MAG: hypothetical protein ABTA24_16660, partial [Arthrobacter sp.]
MDIPSPARAPAPGQFRHPRNTAAALMLFILALLALVCAAAWGTAGPVLAGPAGTAQAAWQWPLSPEPG